MSDYDGIDFAIGSVRGFRRWKVEADGILKPVSHYSGGWMPGDNHAECSCHPKAEQVPKIDDEPYSERNKRIEEWRKTATFEDMACGFYAYFDGRDANGYGSDGLVVSGVIEGFGEVLIGTKGFRAKKARILALSVAPLGGIWKLDEFVVNKIRANYPGVPVFESELAMRAEFPAPQFEALEVPA